MTDENTPDDARDIADVRSAYRALAAERAPDHLDRQVLDAAENAVRRKRTGGYWPWRRPLAWAATIALSLALIIEFTQTGTDYVPAATEPSAVEAPESEAAARERTAAPAAPMLDEALPPAAVEEAEADRMPAAKTAEEKRALDQRFEGVGGIASGSADRAPDNFAAEALRQSAAQSGARLKQESGRANIADRPAEPGDHRCDDDTRADPARWRDCIEALFAARQSEAAMVELGLYQQTFPSAPLPRPQPADNPLE